MNSAVQPRVCRAEKHDTHDRPLDALLALDTEHGPDPVDIFENLLVARLGLTRHPALSQNRWRRLRIASTEAAGARMAG